ncbi:branched-chain amino acid transport system II carrier protein [Sporosarcina sp. P12(2017)]|uniref:branched-chain amino acid transport system II carrier protein n=1 Tax=unclassified Sporosarcina TaxID=2647733 RepID=UPI000C16AC07|nr:MULTISPECIES: branched-chain amino acid transport system II carrier protein [unclassified Sporosarcina]PIC59211.1 branched-chain amino acid transport system II carrier protein [Sporosarcina sp. P10]PIC62532.1 branched-chain amino acid transport system II carrier protein [Sporosarcina sp. P12(2017)]
MSKKHILFTGFMLFSLFFGAGNLIFPPFLGLESGTNFAPAIAGFLITGVLLPFMAVMAIALSDNGLLSMGSRVHKVFGIVFAIIIYMSIGAFYGIPRASNVAYELGFKQIVQVDGNFPLLVFSILFFALTYYISLNPKKIVDRIGQFLTPILLLVLGMLVVQAFIKFDNISFAPKEDYASAPFVNGFLEGYFTMDAVAALAFGIVVINALRDKGSKSKSELVKGTFGAGIIASIGLATVYFSLGWIGKVIPKEQALGNGAEVLTEAARMLFPSGGGLLFGVIVMLACLTTCVGLINACSRFFNEIYPKISYQAYVAIFVLFALLVSNLGLNAILALAIPLLVFIYPISIVLIILSLFQHVAGGGKMMYRLSICITSIFALYEVLTSTGYSPDRVTEWLKIIPFFEYGLGWALPAFVAALAGYIIDKFSRQGNK